MPVFKAVKRSRGEARTDEREFQGGQYIDGGKRYGWVFGGDRRRAKRESSAHLCGFTDNVGATRSLAFATCASYMRRRPYCIYVVYTKIRAHGAPSPTHAYTRYRAAPVTTD